MVKGASLLQFTLGLPFCFGEKPTAANRKAIAQRCDKVATLIIGGMVQMIRT